MAQQTQYLSKPRYQSLLANGMPNVGGTLTFYSPGTSTAKSVYSDSTGVTSLGNVVNLDVYGSAQIWLNGFYDMDEKDKNGNLLYPRQYNISAQYNYSLAAQEWQIQTLVPTYISSTSFSLPGDVRTTFSVNRRVQAIVSAGTVWGTITTSTYSGGVTTVALTLDNSASLDSGLSTVYVGIISPTNSPTYLGSIPAGFLVLSNFATQAANTIVGNGTGSPAAPTALSTLPTIPQKGFADGSAAAAGNVGEILPPGGVANYVVAVATPTVDGLWHYASNNIGLTAGDWDLSATVEISSGGTSWTSLGLAISTSTTSLAGTTTGYDILSAPASSGAGLVVIPRKSVSISATGNYSCWYSITGTGTGILQICLTARRIR